MRDLQARVFQGATLIDVAANIQSRTPAVAIYRKAAFSNAQVQVNIAGDLNTYLSPNAYEWGRTIYPTDLVDVIEDSDGVDRVHSINGVPCVSSVYNAATPATLAFLTANATAATADTASFTAGRTWVYDSVNNAVYLIITVNAGVSVVFDRVFAGASVTTTRPYWLTQDDALTNWYSLPYSNLSVVTTAAAASVIVLGAA